jgi:signal transduction histidine kinase
VGSLTILLVFLIGWIDYVTEWELSLFIFYALPISLAVWKVGTRTGIFVAISCGLIWWGANSQSNPYDTLIGYTWATLSRSFYFGVVVVAVAAVRNRQQDDAARIKMLEEQRQLEQDIVSMSDHEQKRIGQELHDGLCQSLSAIGCAVRMLTEDLQSKELSEAKDAELIEQAIQRTVEEARDLARGIFPVHADNNGLSAAFADFAKTTSRLTGLEIQYEESDEIEPGSIEISMNLFRIAQEAVANAVRHSGAKRINLKLTSDGVYLHLSIEDDGVGIDSKVGNSRSGMGLRTMLYRAKSIGAGLDFRARPGGGTQVICSLPISPLPHDSARNEQT